MGTAEKNPEQVFLKAGGARILAQAQSQEQEGIGFSLGGIMGAGRVSILILAGYPACSPSNSLSHTCICQVCLPTPISQQLGG